MNLRVGETLNYLKAVAGVAATTVIIHLIPRADHVTNISLLYILVVLASAYALGSGPAIVAAVVAVFAFDWFFVQPRHTLNVRDPGDWLALLVFLATAIVVNHLTQSLRFRVEEARQREREAAALSEAGWAVASQVSHERTLTQVLEQVTRIIPSEVAAIVVLSPKGMVEVVASHAEHAGELRNLSVATELREVEAMLRRPQTLKQPNGTPHSLGSPAYLPLVVEQHNLGVLFLRKRGNQPFALQEWRMMQSLANHAAVALERQRLMQAEAQAKALSEVDRMKTALLSMVSHDFRTPLTSIKASVTGLLQQDVSWDAATQRELLEGIDHETDRLNRMVGDILTLSRLEANAWRPQCEMVPVSEVIGAALHGFSAEHNGRIQVRIAPDAREGWFDSVQIVQVLHNLLENALKYSPANSPIELHTTKVGDSLQISVLDCGPGLPPGEETQIFERFYRASRWRESSTPGSGIGLAICRGLVEAHGGHIEASNREGGGALFSFTLPPCNDTPKPVSP